MKNSLVSFCIKLRVVTIAAIRDLEIRDLNDHQSQGLPLSSNPPLYLISPPNFLCPLQHATTWNMLQPISTAAEVN